MAREASESAARRCVGEIDRVWIGAAGQRRANGSVDIAYYAHR
jgi:hypothetical protein